MAGSSAMGERAAAICERVVLVGLVYAMVVPSGLAVAVVEHTQLALAVLSVAMLELATVVVVWLAELVVWAEVVLQVIRLHVVGVRVPRTRLHCPHGGH